MTSLPSKAAHTDQRSGTALVLINGAPGSGKSTMASALAARRPMALALDIDVIKHSLGRWDLDPHASGLQARRVALAMADRHLRDGHSVFVGQYLARPEFIQELDQLAERCSIVFHEVVLELDHHDLCHRIASRHEQPDRPEHAVNNGVVLPEDAVPTFRRSRPSFGNVPGPTRSTPAEPSTTSPVASRL